MRLLATKLRCSFSVTIVVLLALQAVGSRCWQSRILLALARKNIYSVQGQVGVTVRPAETQRTNYRACRGVRRSTGSLQPGPREKGTTSLVPTLPDLFLWSRMSTRQLPQPPCRRTSLAARAESYRLQINPANQLATRLACWQRAVLVALSVVNRRIIRELLL